MNLIDADIIIDLFRFYPPAIRWSETVDKKALLIPGIVAMQVLEGCRDRDSLKDVHDFIGKYKMLWPKRADMRRAIRRFGMIHLKFGTDAFDALIAETAIGAGLPLYTFNTKHFAAYPELTTIQPYSRTKNA